MRENKYKDFDIFFTNLSDKTIFLNLPYPPSNNRNARFGSKGFYKDKSTTDYFSFVKSAFVDRINPVDYALCVSLKVFPNLPKDSVKRAKNDGDLWWLGVRCLDMDNVAKTVLDSLNGICYVDDKQIVRLSVAKMCPDAKGARLEIEITEFKS